MAEELTPAQILDLPMGDNDSGARTIRGYLVELLLTVWRKGEGFSGKRPFGSSCWEWDLYAALACAGVITATFDEDGFIDDMSADQRLRADRLIASAIEALGGVK